MSENTQTFSTTRETFTNYVICDGTLERPETQIWRSRPVAVVVDNRVLEHHEKKVHSLTSSADVIGTFIIAGGEQSKSLEQVVTILQFLTQLSLPKHGLVIAIGGGTVSDVVSIASQMFRRGVALALFPTTLLAQIDAAVGGKNGLNFQGAKNLIGHFYHPETVVCDIEFLSTLGDLEVVGGFAECIKVFAVSDASALHRFFRSRPRGLNDIDGTTLLEMVSVAVQQKLTLLDRDPFELDSRRLLNYGHAFAHCFEEASDFRLCHGEAVLIGMTIENSISQTLKLAKDELGELQSITSSYLTQNCLRYWLSTEEVPKILNELRLTRRGKLNIVCLEKPGQAMIIDDENDDVIRTAWKNAHMMVKDALT